MSYITRREVLALAGAGVAAGVLGAAAEAPTKKSSIKAIAFDAFPVFDPRPVVALAERPFPGKGGDRY